MLRQGEPCLFWLCFPRIQPVLEVPSWLLWVEINQPLGDQKHPFSGLCGGERVRRGKWGDTGWFSRLWWEQACTLCPHPVLHARQGASELVLGKTATFWGEDAGKDSVRVEGGSDPQGASVLLEAALGLSRSPYPNLTPLSYLQELEQDLGMFFT